MLKKLFRQAHNRFATRFGQRLRIEPLDVLQPHDVRDTTNHWGSLLYHAEQQPVVIEAELLRSTDLGGFSLHSSATHPYVLAVAHAREAVRPKQALYHRLCSFQHHLQDTEPTPLSPISGPAGGELRLPWQPDGIRPSRFEPICSQQLSRCADSLYRMLKRAQITRFFRTDEPAPIGAVALISSEDHFRWMPIGEPDRRRAAVFSALGIHRLPLRVERLVIREHLHLWPGVVDGQWSAREAAEAFDRLFNNLLPWSAARGELSRSD